MKRFPTMSTGLVVFVALMCCGACTPQRVVLDIEQGAQDDASQVGGLGGETASGGQGGSGQFSVKPPADDGGATLSADVTSTAGGAVPECATVPASCPGAEMPDWQLADFQPKSSGYQMTYGLKKFAGTTTVVVLLAGW